MRTEWPAWRLVMEGVATLEEMDGATATYSLNDVYKACSLLDMRADIESHQREKERS